MYPIMSSTSRQRRRLLQLLPMLPLLVRPLAFAAEGEAKSWPGIEFAEARAYAWPAKLAPEQVVQKDKTLLPGVINPEGALLSGSQVKRLQAAVTGGHRPYGIARCHIPRHAVVFYDKEKKPVDIFAEAKLPLGNFADAAAFKASISFPE
jgi:hypothetical protein